MGVIGREYVEFGQTGLKDLLAGVRDLDKETKRTQKSTALLKKSMSDGSYARAATDYKRAQTALAGLRKEQEAIARNWQRSQLNAKYGRLGGLAAMHGGDALRSAGAMARGLGSSAVGMAAGLGAPLAVGALANRGFSGTAAASALDAQFTRLSRQVATDLLPAMTALSSVIGRFSGAREKIRSGNATAGDYATSIGGNALMYGSAALGVGKLMGFSAGGMLGGAAGAASKAARFALTGPGALLAGGAYMVNRGMNIGSGQDRLNDLSARRRTADSSSFVNQFTDEEYKKVSDMTENVRGGNTQQDRIRRAERLQYLSDKAFSEHKEKTDRSFLNPRGWFGATIGDDVEKGQTLKLRQLAARRLVEEAKGGEKFGGKKKDDLMRIVEGAGERRSSGDLYEELASGAAKLGGLAGTKQDESNGPIAILGDIRDMLRDIKDKFNF